MHLRFSQPPTVFAAGEFLHVFHRIALVHDLATEQRLHGILQGHDAGRLAVPVLDQKQVLSALDKEVQ